MKKSGFAILLCTCAVTALAAPNGNGFRSIYGSRYRPREAGARPLGPKIGSDSIHRWNQIAIDASGLDHTPVAPGENRVFAEQLGPGRSSRAMATRALASRR